MNATQGGTQLKFVLVKDLWDRLVIIWEKGGVTEQIEHCCLGSCHFLDRIRFLMLNFHFTPFHHINLEANWAIWRLDRGRRQKLVIFIFLSLGCAFQGRPVIIVSVLKRCPGGGKTRGSGTSKRCSHKWFHRIFPCTDPCTNIFCTSPLLPWNSEGVAKKAIRNYLRCSKRFDHRSRYISFVIVRG